MSTPASFAPISKKKKAKEKEREREREKPQLPSERLKIVVRRLPPNLPEDIFWQSVSTWVSDDTVTWKAYYPGKARKRVNKENIPSRAYIAFKDVELLTVFGSQYDGHKFVDKSGNESYAIVEFAPFQKIPAEKKKPDSRNATIEKDEDYISFIESLQASANAEPVSLDTLIAATRPPSPPKTTPLLEALKAQKEKESIIRNHFHYKDASAMNSAPISIHKKEEKRRNGSKTDLPPPSSSKKGKKANVPPPVKQIQIQAKPPAPAPNNNATGPTPLRPQPPSRASRNAKNQAKAAAASPPAPKSPVQAPAHTNGTVSPSPAPVAEGTVPPARRVRPILGLGSRQFEAALSGVGASKKKEKANPPTASVPTVPNATANIAPEILVKPIPPVSPKRPRHKKETPNTNANVTNGVINNSQTAGIAITPSGSVLVVDTGANAPVPVNGGRGGFRRGRGGRGRGGPPRGG